MLSPPVLIFSILFFTELAGAAIAFFAFRRTALAPPAGVSAWAVTGAATGFLFLLHARNAGLVAALVLLGLVRHTVSGTLHTPRRLSRGPQRSWQSGR